MSEPVSAFAAYKSNGVDGKKNASKAKQQQKATAAKKDNARKAGAKKANGSAKKNAGSPNMASKQNEKSKPEPKTKGQVPKPNRKSTVSGSGGIDANKIDELVEELYQSPTAAKKLTKAQQKQKKELEEYLVQELQKDDEEDASFTDEYTLNSSNCGSQNNILSCGGNEIDAKKFDEFLVELYQSPKMLTKSQQKQKMELEEYLVHELQKDDDEDPSFTDEYVLNSSNCGSANNFPSSDGDEIDAIKIDEFLAELCLSPTIGQLKQIYEVAEYLDHELQKDDEKDPSCHSPTGTIGRLMQIFEVREHLVHELQTNDKEDPPCDTSSGEDTSTESTSDSASGTEDETKSEPHKVKQPIVMAKKTSSPNKRKNTESIENATKGKPPKGRRASAPSTVVAPEIKRTLTNGITEPKNVKKNDNVKVTKSNQNDNQAAPTTSAHAAGSNVKLEPLSPPSNIIKMNSIAEGLKVFRWLLNPVSVEDFFAKYWEHGACLVKRKQLNYYQHLISFEAIDQMLLKNHVEFTKNIDVTSYKNGVRETLNPDGRAMPPIVWEHYGNGCSIRLLNPQTFLPSLFKLNATLQEYFHCLVGANAYLTPPNSQGFAPHYDDIEAFVLQVEGRKRWKLYKPRNKSEELPRFSSQNFNQNEIGKPIMEEVLEPGDILYFPRGTIHQACTEPGFHSLHITLSVYQKQSYADLFEKMMPSLLQRAIASSLEMRRGLPLDVWRNAGIAFSENDTKERKEFTDAVTKMLSNLTRSIAVTEVMDDAVDQLAKKFQHEALPPEILPSERVRTIFGSRSTTNERGECVCDYDIELTTNVRLLRANVMRLVKEEGDKLRIYYYLDNSKEYCEYEPNFIEIEPEDGGSVEVLIKSYPEYIGVSQLPIEDDERKISIVTALWERGLLMMEKPFC